MYIEVLKFTGRLCKRFFSFHHHVGLGVGEGVGVPVVESAVDVELTDDSLLVEEKSENVEVDDDESVLVEEASVDEELDNSLLVESEFDVGEEDSVEVR